MMSGEVALRQCEKRAMKQETQCSNSKLKDLTTNIICAQTLFASPLLVPFTTDSGNICGHHFLRAQNLFDPNLSPYIPGAGLNLNSFVFCFFFC